MVSRWVTECRNICLLMYLLEMHAHWDKQSIKWASGTMSLNVILNIYAGTSKASTQTHMHNQKHVIKVWSLIYHDTAQHARLQGRALCFKLLQLPGWQRINGDPFTAVGTLNLLIPWMRKGKELDLGVKESLRNLFWLTRPSLMPIKINICSCDSIGMPFGKKRKYKK